MAPAAYTPETIFSRRARYSCRYAGSPPPSGRFICALLSDKPAVKVARYLVAVGFIVIGLARVLGYFANDLYRLAFQYDLAIGSLSVILAVLVLIYPDNLMAILPFGMGIYVLSDALLKLQTAIDAKLFGMRQWIGLLVASLIASVAGVISLIVSVSLQEPTALVGIAIAADGALNFFNTMATVRVGAQKKDRMNEGEKKN